jgi:large subunit ribosomal protein L23
LEEKRRETIRKKASPVAPVSSAKDVLLRPRVTEKAANLTSENVYTFDVRKEATKKDVVEAISALYKVKPVKVRIVNSPSKRVAMRRKRGFGVASGVKKAYVFLKEGDSITLA